VLISWYMPTKIYVLIGASVALFFAGWFSHVNYARNKANAQHARELKQLQADIATEQRENLKLSQERDALRTRLDVTLQHLARPINVQPSTHTVTVREATDACPAAVCPDFTPDFRVRYNAYAAPPSPN